MALKDLEKLGAFVSDALVKKDIRFKLNGPDEYDATVFVKQLSMGEYERLIADKDSNLGASARIIAAAVTFSEDGSERITADKAFKLHKGIANALLDAIQEVNGGKN